MSNWVLLWLVDRFLSALGFMTPGYIFSSHGQMFVKAMLPHLKINTSKWTLNRVSLGVYLVKVGVWDFHVIILHKNNLLGVWDST